ncbi:MAG TPA: O-antigen ligase family protein [Bryobacteraceae bacterium]|nr:O-antigen ligase family protein [Bryobacteraceae bacterium]
MDERTAAEGMIASAQAGDMLHQVASLLLGALGVFLLRGSRSLSLSRGIKPILVMYAAWVCVSAFWADQPFVTARRQLGFGMEALFCAGVVARFESWARGAFIAWLAGMNLAIGFANQIYRGGFDFLGVGGRFAGTVDTNVQGATLAAAAILVLWGLPGVKRLRRIGLAVAAAAFLVFLLLTRSRTSLLALTAALAFSALLSIARRWYRKPTAATIALAFFAASIAVVGALCPDWIQRTSATVSHAMREERDVGDVSELTGRTVIWEECLKWAAQRPVLGFGFGSFWTAERVEAITEDMHWTAAHAHSAYLDEYLALGLPGAVLFAALLLGCLICASAKFLRGGDEYGPWAALIVFFCIHGTTESLSILPTFPGFALTITVLSIALRSRASTNGYAAIPSQLEARENAITEYDSAPVGSLVLRLEPWRSDALGERVGMPIRTRF